MSKNHLKRIFAPKTWNIHRKKTTFITRPRPGGLVMAFCTPLSVILIEQLNIFKTRKELKYALSNKEVLVNQKPVFETRFSVGLLDVISIPKLNKFFRLIVDTKNKLIPLSITPKQATCRICKIVNKTTLSKKKNQITTMEGRTFLVDKDEYKIGDSVLYEFDKKKTTHHIKCEKGQTAYVFKGRHTGKVIQVDDIKDNKILFKEGKETHETGKRFIIIIGKEVPELQK